MKFLKTGMFLMAVSIASGCTVSAKLPGVKASLPGVEVEVGSSGGGKGCPPGLAKQGRC